MEDSRETLLDYARLHGLARDHISRDLDSISYLAIVKAEVSWEFEDPKDASTIISPDDFVEPEKLVLDANAAKLLASILRASSTSNDEEPDLFDVRTCRTLKLDIPLLRTDPELDYKTFGTRKPEKELICSVIPILLDGEYDEDISWTREQTLLPAKYDELCDMEKLEVPKESAVWLQGVLHEDLTEEDLEVTYTQEVVYEKNTALQPITPPLMPLTPPRTSPGLSPLVDNINLLSERTTPGKAELEDIERTLIEERTPDSLNTPSHGLQDLHDFLDADGGLVQSSPDSRYTAPLSSSSPLKARAGRLRLEEPLAPATPPRSTKHVSWSDELVHMNIIRATFDEDEMDAGAEEDLAYLFDHIIEPHALQVETQIHNETLEDAGSTARVRVPVLDSTKRPPPWKINISKAAEKEETDELMLVIAKMKCHHWSVMKIERDIPWCPFAPELARVAIDEHVDDIALVVGSIEQLGLEDSTDIESLTWKPEGLRILDDDADAEDEELRPASFQDDPTDLANLLEQRKRKLKLSSAGSFNETSMTPGGAVSSSHDTAESRAKSHPPKPVDSACSIATKPTLGNFFSATNDLDRFMGMQTGQTPKRQKLAHSSTTLPSPKHSSTAQPVTTTAIADSPLPPTQRTQLPFPSPPTTTSQTPRPIIISSTFLHTRPHLIRHITRIYPSISLIPRDPHATATTSPNADFAISPATGLICTTLQEIKQKPLPGQPTHSHIRSRIMAVAPYFERLTILVSDQSLTIHVLEERDCTALNELTTFAVALEDDVTITFIGGGDGGGEENLARWITGLISATPLLQADVVLLQDITLWELFLTKAGMNPFAAQTVLSESKTPHVEEEADDSGGLSSQKSVEGQEREAARYGLSAFVMMEAEERVERFARLLGGRKVLRRVGRVLDGGWGGEARAS